MTQKDLQWEVIRDRKIRKTFYFKDFKAALIFVNRVAALAEKEGHHPDIHIVKYNSVIIELSTHETGGLSEKDYALARKIEFI
ncbi:MAG: 4a-hydroxytetrahydrobiopterin dehydratase [Patescibacteria group bacterium]|nr:4a-hydroxytetrahydrobiopterin dehydratase [Patescibacteria group bacterium]